MARDEEKRCVHHDSIANLQQALHRISKHRHREPGLSTHELQKQERVLVASLNEKYGAGNLDPNTGVFTPNEK